MSNSMKWFSLLSIMTFSLVLSVGCARSPETGASLAAARDRMIQEAESQAENTDQASMMDGETANRAIDRYRAGGQTRTFGSDSSGALVDSFSSGSN